MIPIATSTRRFWPPESEPIRASRFSPSPAFESTIGIIHDGSGQLQPLGDEERRIYHEMQALEKSSFTRINAFQDNIAKGQPKSVK